MLKLRFTAIRNGFMAIGLLAVATAFALPSAASSSTSATEVSEAITWAVNHNHQAIYDQQCLAFVTKAYAEGGVDIGSIGESNGAAQYWAKNPKNYVEHPNNTDPPVGALVFWGPTPAPWSNPYGHVGIYLGNDTVISSASWPESSAVGEVHEFSFSGRNAASDGLAPNTPGFYPYLGWMAPTGTPPSVSTAGRVVLGLDWADYITGFDQAQPAKLHYAGDGYSELSNIKWSDWGTSKATGIGTGWYVPPGDNNGQGSDRKVSIVAFDLGKCGSVKAYTAMDWFFPSAGEKQIRNPHLDTCEGNDVEQGCDPVVLAGIGGKFLVSKAIDPGHTFYITGMYCRGDYAVASFNIRPVITNNFSSGEFVFKRIGGVWTVLNNDISGFDAVPGIPTPLLNSLSNLMTTTVLFPYPVPIPT